MSVVDEVREYERRGPERDQESLRQGGRLHMRELMREDEGMEMRLEIIRVIEMKTHWAGLKESRAGTDNISKHKIVHI